MTAALAALVAMTVAALIWRMREADKVSRQLLERTTELGVMTAAFDKSETGRLAAEDGVVELADQLEAEQARAAAVAADLGAKLAEARVRLAKYVPGEEPANVLNDILTPRRS